MRALALLLSLLALALAPRARAGTPGGAHPPPPPPSEPPSGAARTEVHLRFPPWRPVGTFRLVGASGEVSDTGIAREDGDPGQGAPLVLEGARGTLVLKLRSGAKTPVFPPVFGRWVVVRGTGAYAHLAGAGTFTTSSSGSAVKGSPFEVQTFVGHVWAAR